MNIETLSRKHLALREAAIILVASALLGLAYTFVMKRGFFAPPPPIAQQSASTAPTFISYEEAKSFFTAGNALFVDARHDFDYTHGHIAGAINVPLKEFDLATSPLATVPKDRLIITYCDGAECNSSIELAQKLATAGFSNVKIFFGGWNEWQQHHLATE